MTEPRLFTVRATTGTTFTPYWGERTWTIIRGFTLPWDVARSVYLMQAVEDTPLERLEDWKPDALDVLRSLGARDMEGKPL